MNLNSIFRKKERIKQGHEHQGSVNRSAQPLTSWTWTLFLTKKVTATEEKQGSLAHHPHLIKLQRCQSSKSGWAVAPYPWPPRDLTKWFLCEFVESIIHLPVQALVWQKPPLTAIPSTLLAYCEPAQCLAPLMITMLNPTSPSPYNFSPNTKNSVSLGRAGRGGSMSEHIVQNSQRTNFL